MPGYHLPPFAAVNAGIFQEHGLDVEILDPAPGSANVRRVAAGDADFCLTSVPHYLRAWQDQPDVAARFIFAVAQRGHMAAFVVDGRPTAAGVVPTHPRDLEGARVGGTPGSPFLQEYLNFAHEILGLCDTPVVDISYSDALHALGSGEFDVFADYIDLDPRIQSKNPGVTLRAFHYADYGLDIYGSGLFTSDRMIQERPETIQRFVKGMRAAYEYQREHPTAGLESLMRRFPETDPVVARAGWQVTRRLVFGWESQQHGPGWFDPERWSRTLRYESRVLGLPLPPVDATFDARFVQTTPLANV